MPPASLLLTFALASFVLLIIPGPAVLYIVNRSVSDGRRVGLSAAAGLTLRNLTHVIAATVGLSAVLAASATGAKAGRPAAAMPSRAAAATANLRWIISNEPIGRPNCSRSLA